MKIGTITFHWATNYGAVLQAFALQMYLEKRGYETEIINYIPINVKSRQVISNIKSVNINEILKEHRINKFRKRYLKLSTNTYFTNKQLSDCCLDYDLYICGSDQVWNEWFLLYSEKAPNLSYYLNFVKDGKHRISYATSFGTEKLTQKVSDLVKPELKKFKNIGLRERTGKDIVEKLGIKGTLVVDPTLLLDSQTYYELIQNIKIKEHFNFFSYILHENQKLASRISEYIFENFFDKSIEKKFNQQPIGVLEWLYYLNNSRFVLTNSFHGVVFSIIFHRPFIVVPVEGAKMNDRINTLLSLLNLESRIIAEFNEENIDNLIKEEINWEKVEVKLRQLKRYSEEFIVQSIEE